MKHLYLLPLALLLLGCKSNVLEVSIDDAHSGEAYFFNTYNREIDTVRFNGNSFTFIPKGIEQPTLFYFVVKDINDFSRPIYLILSNQETIVNFNELIAVDENSQNSRDLYPNRPFFISDPNENEAFYRFQDLWITFYNSVTQPELDLATRKEMHNKFINVSEGIIKEHNDKLVTALIINYLMINNLIQLDQIQLLYSCLEPEIQNSFIGQKIKSEVGFDNQTAAPKFSIQDFHGNNYSLDSLKGNKVLLHFWSSTCAPCFEEIPALLRLANEKKDIVIINISLDTDKSRWINAMERIGITNMITYCDFNNTNGKIAMDYKIKSIPANYLIDEKGNIISKKENIQGIIEDL